MKSETQSPKRRAFIISQRPSDYVEMSRAAKALKHRGWEIHFLYFHGETESDKDVIEHINQQGEKGDFSHVVLRHIGMRRHSEVEKLTEEFFNLARIQALISRFFKKVLFGRLRNYAKKNANSLTNIVLIFYNSCRIVLFYLLEKKGLRELIKQSKPDIIIVPEDVVGYISPLLIKAGHELNVPAIVLPYTIANEQEAFRSLSGEAHYHLRGLWNRLTGKMFPNWVMSQDGLSLVRMPAPYILGQVLTNTSPPNPWMMNSGFANAIAVENLAMKEYYQKSGIPESKISVVGAISDDHLARFKLNKACELKRLKNELSITEEKPVLVVGGCPDQSGCCPPGFEYDDFDHFVIRLAGLIETLASDYCIIFRPHPNNLRMGSVLEQYGFIVTCIDTARLVALSDVYVAFASATIRWAIASEVPVVNYDLFHYDYEDFKGVPGVLNVASDAGFKDALESIRPSCDKFADLQRDVKLSAHRWGMLDGKSTDRIMALIDELCAYEKVPRTST